ncbi:MULTISPECIES: type III-A CRISPR-associated RAMP protein Csm5 [Streptococcus]|jgi:CRISPR-associated RAMP protein, csm5 family|uniref:type III-A CRISPR-associated RAMP protein Csm5 n=1 Tax=Streptococcus TaxID=1301 RepID=UPI0001F89AF2|nr:MULTISPECIES: type III-A CRISPR-associated RAMP protein Csm5 [Streptococcus]EFX56785.1 CRISPR-associated RAMP protein, Csm5 family [Streptococcus sp. C300]OFL47532.1 type III-A CRISPR-associated RAMP protein Csm5 [Streptococcus sp. HMSC076C08]OFO18768.1 type III-A CRISPR-associated RAMP protein Csm5 [Streptococcus sp. HMSC072D05]OFP32234.1 type III-A CRISPR-associated RAMP protein Csm5 [Streptococcus sp. HMSC072D07]RSI48133.1 RAMP superfamily protein [Streptococcus oralis]
MKTEYRTFQFTLLAMAPIHTGSGDKYTSREFIYEDGYFYFPDMGKFYNRMVEKGYDQKFERFLQERKASASNNRLISFLEDNRISDRDFGGYRIKETGFETEKNNIDSKLGTINEVSKFMRDSYGNPYIPGSSLKGAIRTILMNTNPDWNNENVVKDKKENKSLIPWGAKKGQNYDDLFNTIRVSDSKPFRNDSLILVQKWDHKATTPLVKPLPLYREALTPGKIINFKITTTTKEAGELIEKLGEKAFEFYNDYKIFFLKDFPENKIQPNIQYPIYLGAGSGAWTKTIFKQAKDILQERYENSRTTRMVEKGVLKLTKAPMKSVKTTQATRKLIMNNESFYEMGKANFMIKEITNDNFNFSSR